MSKAEYKQIMCAKCLQGLMPIYEENQNVLGLYCRYCDIKQDVPIVIRLNEGVVLYENR